METRHKHKIDKIHLRINTPSEDDGHYLKDNAGKWVNERVLSCLEDYIASVETEIGENIIQFNKLKISLEMKDGQLRDSNICQQIKDQLDDQIRAFLNKAKATGRIRIQGQPGTNVQEKNHYPEKDPESDSESDLQAAMTVNHAQAPVSADDLMMSGGNVIDPKKRAEDALFHFLKTGRCAWWMSAPDMNELLEEPRLISLLSNASPAFYNSLVSLLTSSATRTRLIRQFTDKMLQRILIHTFYSIHAESFPSGFEENLPSFVHKLSVREKEQFWSAVMLLLQVSRQETKRNDPASWTEILRPVFASGSNNFPFSATTDTTKAAISADRRSFLSWLEKLTTRRAPARIREILTGEEDPETLRWAIENKLISAGELSDEIQPVAAQPLTDTHTDPDPDPAVQPLADTHTDPDPAALALEKMESPVGSKSPRENQPEVSLEAGLIVENAGLILLNLYLKSFLLQTGLISEKNAFTDPELAVHVLHYLATGRQYDWDYNLLFEKFLCNIPLDESIGREREIPLEIKEEADALLKAVVENWSALGQSSIDLLRNEFLQRSGKLFRDEMSVRLVVERKTQDILIDRIPWGFSTTKLPWQKDLIYTTW